MRQLLYLMIFVFLIISCNTKNVPSPGLEVTPGTATYRVGDTAWFQFKGNPYNITFYSGEPGHAYQYRSRTEAAGKTILQFNSATATGSQPVGLQLLISSDFTGAYDSSGIYNAAVHWTDITNRAVLATTSTSKASGAIDLSDFAGAGRPVYLAFRYTAAQSGTAQRTWTLTSLAINNIVGDSNYIFPAATIGDAVWTLVNMDNTAVKWTVSATQLQVKGGAAGSPATENWVVSRAVDLSRAIPDAGVPVKNISNNLVSSYFYIYTKPGAYTASFAAANTTVYDSRTSLKEVQVTITP